MPKNQFQRMVFAFITVLITVHAYVFYSLYIVNGKTLMEINNATSVIEAINNQGGIYMLGKSLPICAIIIIEFICAYTLEIIAGGPVSFKLASKIFNPKKDNTMLFESAIICATVGIMCPAMSLLAAFFYYPYYEGFRFITLLANWIKLICYNFPFAFFTQLFFIQPLVRTIFKFLFKNNNKQKAKKHN